MHSWRLTPTAVCDCGAERQTPEHLLYQCPIYSLARKDELLILDDNTIDWLLNVCPGILSPVDDQTTTPQTKEECSNLTTVYIFRKLRKLAFQKYIVLNSRDLGFKTR